MLFNMRVGFTYGVNLYLVTLLAAAYCGAEPWLAKAWVWLQEYLSRRAQLAWMAPLLHPVAWAVALFFFLMFDDQDTKFIYFQF
jgi:hypothetical protein